MYLEPDEVLAIAKAGDEAGCTEALFTLGDRPEERWPQAASFLECPRPRFDDRLRGRDVCAGAR